MFNDKEKIIGKYFDDCARDGFMHSFTSEENIKLEGLFKDWDIHIGEHIFEPGCGSGRLTELIARYVGTSGAVYACDLSSVMINLATDRNLPEQVVLYHGSVAEVPVEDNFFDKVLLFQVFPHFEDRSNVLRKIHRVLKEDGNLWINHLKSREAINSIHQNASKVVISHLIPDEKEIRTLLESSGYSIDGIWDSADSYSVRARKKN